MPSDLAVYLAGGALAPGANPFGRTIANRELYRALAQHGGFAKLDFVTQDDASRDGLLSALDLAGADHPSIGAVRRGSGAALAAASGGSLLRGDPDLYDLAWERRAATGDGGYSLVGLIHTLAPPEIRKKISLSTLAPVQPWDAVICTSPAVQAAAAELFDAWDDHARDRFGGVPPRPALPLIPLGVDGARMAALADRPQARASLRAELGLEADDVLVLWVGRLSFFEKAYPQPMFRALEQAAQATGVRVVFAMAGWFPSGQADRALYEEAAQAYAPSVRVVFENGNDAGRVADLWAGADIFLSLVDNIQETFGLTPVEAMAAGLPVVVSDWDGYRYTVRDGIDGFLVPTLGGPEDGTGERLGRAHGLQIESYQSYVGTVAQFTAVNVGRAAEALSRLIASPDLRRTMGSAGRSRVATTFDWPVVIGAFKALFFDLDAIRATAPASARRPGASPIRVDPFRDFSGFATQALTPSTRLSVPPGVTAADLVRADNVELDRKAAYRRLPFAKTVHAFGLIQRGEAQTVEAVMDGLPDAPRDALQLTLLWMCKLGLLTWLD